MNAFCLRPRVAELIFQLYTRPLHPELFDILAVRTFRREDYELTARITRTGHTISWQSGDLHLTEVAAAAGQPLPEHRAVVSRPLRSDQSDVSHALGDFAYRSIFQVETLPPEIFLHVHGEILADGGKGGLLYDFQPNYRTSLAPLGFVTVASRADCLFVSSFHTFPDEFTVVKSQSLIERRE